MVWHDMEMMASIAHKSAPLSQDMWDWTGSDIVNCFLGEICCSSRQRGENTWRDKANWNASAFGLLIGRFSEVVVKLCYLYARVHICILIMRGCLIWLCPSETANIEEADGRTEVAV